MSGRIYHNMNIILLISFYIFRPCFDRTKGLDAWNGIGIQTKINYSTGLGSFWQNEITAIMHMERIQVYGSNLAKALLKSMDSIRKP